LPLEILIKQLFIEDKYREYILGSNNLKSQRFAALPLVFLFFISMQDEKQKISIIPSAKNSAFI